MTGRFLISGPLRLDLTEERLWRDGKVVPLGGRVFILLRAFMSAPQKLLTKDEIIDQVWSGLAVSDSVLTTAIKDLRRALGDDARNPTIVKTVHGRGYRFMPAVETSDDAFAAVTPVGITPAPVTASRRWLLLAGLGGVAVVGGGIALSRRAGWRPPDKSVAVLPFKDLSERGDQAWFADGLTEEVLNALARTPDLRVVSQSVSARFRDSQKPPSEIGRELNVGALLEGAVRRSGERLRVSVDLIRSSDGEHIWSNIYDGQGGEVIAIQENIAFDIARALKTVMDPVKLRSMVEAGTRSAAAYEAYLHGLSLSQREQRQGDIALADTAGEAYDLARKLDPGFAAAHWAAAQHWFGATISSSPPDRGGLSEDELLRRYLERVDMAIATSRNDVDRLKYSAAAAMPRLRFREAHRLWSAYVKARPGDLDGWEAMSNISSYLGDRREQGVAAERLHELSMRDQISQGWSISASIQTEDYPTAATRARAHLTAEPSNPYIQFQAHRALIYAGRIGEAGRLLKRISASTLPATTRQLASLRQACAEGRTADAAALRRQIDLSAPIGVRWNTAQAMGDTKGADALLRPLDNAQGLPTLMQFMVYPNFDARAFPALSAQLDREGIVRPPLAKLPYVCKPA